MPCRAVPGEVKIVMAGAVKLALDLFEVLEQSQGPGSTDRFCFQVVQVQVTCKT